ncbi:MAG TPA: hypothetical protein PKK10_03945 [Woeseiaceae bacterium]|nr:hypothetical protein [Woeseiaceae bacterium]
MPITGVAALALAGFPATITNSSISPEERAKNERREQTEKASEILRAMMTSERVYTVMTLLDGEPRPFDMWKAWELMRDDVTVDGNEFWRFRKATNDPRIGGGAARHALPEGDLPDDPMSVPDAVIFIREIVARWIKEIARREQSPRPASDTQ